MPLTVPGGRKDRITISHAGDSDPLVFEGDINALLAEGVRAAYVAHRCVLVITEGPLTRRMVAGPEEGL